MTSSFKQHKAAAALIALSALSAAHSVWAQEQSSPGQAPPVQAQTSKDRFPDDPRRVIWFRHLQDLPADIKTAGLHIDIPEAPAMTRRITEQFAQAGYKMVPVDQAVYRYEIRGNFSSDGKLKTHVPLGQMLEGAVTGSLSGASAAKRAGDVAFAAVLANQAVMAGLATSLWATGDLISSVLEAAGVKDAFNTALTGDRRGVCLVGCTYWNWSDQSVALGWRDPRSADKNSGSALNVGVFAQGVFVEELTALAVNEFLRHHGVAQTPEPQTERRMPIKAFGEIVTGGRIKITRALIE